MAEKILGGYDLLAVGLEGILSPAKFRDRLEEVCEGAFADVFRQQDEGKLKWKHLGRGPFELTTRAVVKNGRGESITIPVVFFTSFDNGGFKGGYLMLGSKENSPCRNDADPRVRRLYQQITGEAWS